MIEKSKSESSQTNLEQKYQDALDDLKQSYHDQVSRLEDKITAKNSNISELAIDKLLKLLKPILLFFSGLVVVVSFFGYSDLKEDVTSMAKRKVNAWLSYDTKKSPINQNILDIRDRYLIDSVYLRYLRHKSSRNGHNPLTITDKELADLIRIANNKSTSLRDYSDILEIYKSRFLFSSIGFRGDYDGKLFDKVFMEGGFKEQVKKQRQLLSVFSYDYSLYSIAREILDSKKSYLENSAFSLVANVDSDYAVKYANENLLGKSFETFDMEMALTLAKYDARSDALKNYIERLYKARDNFDFWFSQYIDIFSQLSSNVSKESITILRDTKLEKFKNEMALNIFQRLIEGGYSIDVDDVYDGRIKIQKRSNYSVTLNRTLISEIYENTSLLNKLVKFKINDVKWLSKTISALEIPNHDEYLVTIMVNLDDSSSIVFGDNESISKSDVMGSLWMTLDRQDNSGLQVIYRNKAGEFNKHSVSSVKNIEKSEFFYRYLKKDLYAFVPETSFL